MTQNQPGAEESDTTKDPLGYRLWRHVLSIGTLIMLAGCATVPEVKPLPASIRADMRSIAIAVSTKTDAVTVWRPTASSAAREGVSTAVEAATVLTRGLWPIFFYGAGTIAVPSLGAAIGYLLGAIKEPPQAEVQRVESMLRRVVEETGISRIIGETIVEKLSETDPQIRTMIADYSEDNPSMAVTLANRGIGTILELNITKLEVAGPWGSDPAKKVAMTVAARIVRSGDGSILYSQDFGFTGNQDVEEWYLTATDARANSRALREVLIHAAETLGKDITRALYSSSENSSGAPTTGGTEGEQEKTSSYRKQFRTEAQTSSLQS